MAPEKVTFNQGTKGPQAQSVDRQKHPHARPKSFVLRTLPAGGLEKLTWWLIIWLVVGSPCQIGSFPQLKGENKK